METRTARDRPAEEGGVATRGLPCGVGPVDRALHGPINADAVHLSLRPLPLLLRCAQGSRSETLELDLEQR